MIPRQLALEKVLSFAYPTQEEWIELPRSLHRYLARDIHSDVDQPPFNKSAVDGYACRREDLGKELILLEIVPAGSFPQYSIGPGTCSKIMTGAPVPQGADCVVMVEDSLEADGKVSLKIDKSATNIAWRAEDVAKGDLVLPLGTRMGPAAIAVLATVGCFRVPVKAMPKAFVYSTGDELVEPWSIPSPAQIRNSNGWQLAAQLEKAGAYVCYMGIVPDSKKSFLEVLAPTLSEPRIILFSGSVSMGDFDLLPNCLEESGFEIIFRKMAIQPGKPTVFAVRGNDVVFALPGNPVSCFTLMELLVIPFIERCMGSQQARPFLRFPLGKDYVRKNGDREKWIPFFINEKNELEASEYHGSAHIHALTRAQGVFCFPIGVLSLSKGDLVDARLF